MRIEDRALDLPAEEGARFMALGLVAEARAAARALADGSGDERLHDFRVALRRLRSTLRALRGWLGRGVRPRHDQKLKRIARSTNEARDAEVQLAWLATKRDALPSPRQRVGYDMVVARLEARTRRDAETARVAERLGRTARRLERRLARYERKPGGADAFGRLIASLIDDQVGALSARMAAIRHASDEDAVHRARIEAKRLRYLLEPLRGLRRADAGPVIVRLKRLQDVLGELHDAHVLAGELRDALAEAAAQRARQLHAAAYAHHASDRRIRDALRASARPGLLALVRLVGARRDVLHEELEREWLVGGMGALVTQTRALAAAIEGRAIGTPAGEPASRVRSVPPRARRRAGALHRR